jgi:hypothetical protein
VRYININIMTFLFLGRSIIKLMLYIAEEREEKRERRPSLPFPLLAVSVAFSLFEEGEAGEGPGGR